MPELKSYDHAFLVSEQQRIKRLMLTQLQRIALSKVDIEGGITSREVADILKVSIQHANSILLGIWEKGYLVREDVGDPTGGSMYLYKLPTSH